MTFQEENREVNFINNYDYQDKQLMMMKLSKNADYTHCYMDFFLYEKTDLKYIKLTTPYIVWLSGEGTFIRPFYLCENDVFLNALFYIINRNIDKMEEVADERQKLCGALCDQNTRRKNSKEFVKFINRFNMQASSLDIGAPNRVFLENLLLLIKLLEEWNNRLFNRCLVTLDLLFMIN